jgi:hypothetical protein
MAVFGDVQVDGRAVEELLTDPAGPVGRLLQELAVQGTVIARAAAPVRNTARGSRGRAGRGSSALPPGYTKAGVRTHDVRVGRAGTLYAGVDAPAEPAIYLEYPASQMHRKYPFLTVALDALEHL